MKNSRRIIGLIAIALIGSMTILSAQRGQKQKVTPEERAAKQTERLTQDLGLSPAQAEQVHALHLAQAEEKAAARANGTKKGKSGKKGKGKNKAAREAFNAEMQSILTPEQFATLKKGKGRKGKGRKGKRKRNVEESDGAEQF